MASLGLRCGGGGNPLLQYGNLDHGQRYSPPMMVKCLSSSINNRRPNRGRISISNNMVMTKKKKQEEERSIAIERERLDKWMRDSVVEIVKNLTESPLLVHVYNREKEKETSLRTERVVVEEQWPEVMRRWERKEEEKPEGMIFVDKLEGEEERERVVAVDDGCTRAWGVVVQGRGMGCGPACYLLKTSRVGPACHFCLVRVKSFRMSAMQQLQDCWLSNS